MKFPKDDWKAFQEKFPSASNRLESLFGQGLAETRKVERSIPVRTGIWSVDDALGGGLPGGLTELYGEDKCGKTAFAGACLSRAQKDGVKCLLIQADYLDVPYLTNLGVDTDRLPLLRSMTAMAAFEAIESFSRLSGNKFVVIDHLNNMTVEEGDDAWSVYRGFLKEVAEVIDAQTSVLVLAQVRQDRTLTGAFRRKTRSSLSKDSTDFSCVLEMSRTDVSFLSYDCELFIHKNTLTSPFKRATFRSAKGHGPLLHLGAVEYMLEKGLVTVRGSWVYVGDLKIGHGAAGAAEYFRQNPELFERIYQKMSRQ